MSSSEQEKINLSRANRFYWDTFPNCKVSRTATSSGIDAILTLQGCSRSILLSEFFGEESEGRVELEIFREGERGLELGSARKSNTDLYVYFTPEKTYMVDQKECAELVSRLVKEDWDEDKESPSGWVYSIKTDEDGKKFYVVSIQKDQLITLVSY